MHVTTVVFWWYLELVGSATSAKIFRFVTSKNLQPFFMNFSVLVAFVIKTYENDFLFYFLTSCRALNLKLRASFYSCVPLTVFHPHRGSECFCDYKKWSLCLVSAYCLVIDLFSFNFHFKALWESTNTLDWSYVIDGKNFYVWFSSLQYVNGY